MRLASVEIRQTSRSCSQLGCWSNGSSLHGIPPLQTAESAGFAAGDGWLLAGWLCWLLVASYWLISGCWVLALSHLLAHLVSPNECLLVCSWCCTASCCCSRWWLCPASICATCANARVSLGPELDDGIAIQRVVRHCERCIRAILRPLLG